MTEKDINFEDKLWRAADIKFKISAMKLFLLNIVLITDEEFWDLTN